MSEPDPFCDKTATRKTIIFESKHFMVLYNISPVVKGHVLFVPKRHVSDLLELRAAEVNDLHSLFGRVLPTLLSTYGADDGSYDISAQIGRYSGRTIAHLHIHALPRTRHDRYQDPNENIFQDIRQRNVHLPKEELAREIKMLRKKFRYRPETR